MKKMALWIKFFAISLEFWITQGFSDIVSAVGKSLYVDLVTEESAKLKYARIHVKLLVNSRYPNTLEICLSNGDVLSLKLEYNWKLVKYIKYKCFGHITNECIPRIEEKKPKIEDKKKNRGKLEGFMYGLNGEGGRNIRKGMGVETKMSLLTRKENMEI